MNPERARNRRPLPPGLLAVRPSPVTSPLFHLPQHPDEHCPEGRTVALWRVARGAPTQYVRAMLAKVHYPGPNGEDRAFDAEVPEPPPRTHVFTNPVDGTEVRATLEEHQDAMDPGGGVAIYGAESDSP